MSAQNLTCPAPIQADPYPTRLHQQPEQHWHERRENTVKGRHLPGPLTEQQLNLFEENGFLFEPGFLPPEEVASLTEAMSELLNREDYRGKPFTITEPNSHEIRSVFAVHFLHRAFQHLARDPRLTQRVEQILGGGHYVHQSRINYKPGFKGKGFNWHSDFETWHAEDGMPAMHAVSASIILTDNHSFNGPLMLIPGSHKHFIPCVGPTPDEHHKQSLKTQQIGVPSEQALAAMINRHGIDAPTGPAGSLLLFDCNTLHGSNANMSPDPRSNVFFVFNRRDNACHKPYAAKKRRPRFLGHEPDRLWQADDS